MDLDLFRSINLGWRNPLCDVFFAALSYSGLGSCVAIVAIVLLLKKEARIYAFSMGLAAILGGTAIAHTFKGLMPRERPSNLPFAVVQEPIYHSSFPSAHTATAFAVATALAILASRQGRWWGVILAYVWAFGVGLSRIYRGVHWPTDVAGGICAGIIGGCLATIIIDLVTKGGPSKKA
ncbi:MAG: phosphatase PAP2 family protein [Armatimonadetes bacterium]|nr:phosphatase PAP2 family protein [Armatimonadota bacterium]